MLLNNIEIQMLITFLFIAYTYNWPTYNSTSALSTKHTIYTQTTPLEITIQAGEFEVFKSICQTSIPYILGWNTCMDIASAAAISKGISGGGGQMY